MTTFVYCCLLAVAVAVSGFTEDSIEDAPNLHGLGVTEDATIFLDKENLNSILTEMVKIKQPYDLEAEVGKLYAAVYHEIDNRVEVNAFYHPRNPTNGSTSPKFVSACTCKFFFFLDGDMRGVIERPNCWIVKPFMYDLKGQSNPMNSVNQMNESEPNIGLN